MTFVPTPQQVEALVAVPREFRFFNGSVLSVEVPVDRGILADHVPAALREGVMGTIRMTFGTWDSNCAGSYTSASITIPTSFASKTGEYVVVMYVDTERAVRFGRDWFGEPKTHGEVNLDMSTSTATATLSLNGDRLLSVYVDVQREGFCGRTETRNYNIRARLDPNSEELVADAALTELVFTSDISAHRVGRARLEIPAGSNSPFAHLGLPQVGKGRLLRTDMTAVYSELAALTPREAQRFVIARMGHIH